MQVYMLFWADGMLKRQFLQAVKEKKKKKKKEEILMERLKIRVEKSGMLKTNLLLNLLTTLKIAAVAIEIVFFFFW